MQKRLRCPHRERAVWIQGATVKLGAYRCPLLHSACTERTMRDCPFAKKTSEKELYKS